MITPDDIFRIADRATFDAAALEVFRRQARDCAPYREYLARIGVRAECVDTPEKIPYLPIGLFKTHDIYCGEAPPEVVFTSSATTGMTPSRHPMRSLALYEQAFTIFLEVHFQVYHPAALFEPFVFYLVGAEGYGTCGVHESRFVCFGTTHFGFQIFAGGFHFL